MNGKTDNRLVEALIVGLVAGACYLARRRLAPAPRSAWPDFAGNFAL